jgi:UDP-glucose 4-epimerase
MLKESEMPSVLITGASGFIGLNLVECFLSRGWQVLGLSIDGIPALALKDFDRLPGRLEDLRADARDLRLLDERLGADRFDAVIAGAAITSGIERERTSPGDIVELNLLAAVRLLELAARHHVPRMLMFSSSAATGELAFGGRPVFETDPVQPASIYGATKAAVEGIVRRWNAIAPVPAVWVPRLSAVFGPWERSTGVRDALSAPYQVVRAAIRGEAIEPLPKGGARDWAYAPAVAEAIFWMLTEDRSVGDRHYQLCPGYTWHPSMMLEALQANGVTVRVAPGGTPIGFNEDTTRERWPLSAERLSRAFQPPPDARTASLAYARWAIEHPAWFDDSKR